MFQIIFAVLLAILPPCPTEDTGLNCGWDASTRGNGIGTSYVILDSSVGPLLVRSDGKVMTL